MVWCVAVCCSVSHEESMTNGVAAWCSASLCVAVCRARDMIHGVLQCVAVCCRLLQRVQVMCDMVFCSVLQRGAVCCSVS